MRTLFTVLILSAACAGPALAQDLTVSARYEALWQEQQAANRMAQQRSVALENQFGALEAQVQTETRLRNLDAQRDVWAAPVTGKPPPPIALPSNIDKWMADSNARVRAAAANRR
jgi:predicted phage-related endonuclease